LSREGLSHRILLRGLTEHDVERFIEITAGVKPPAALVEAVYRETEGNPFFVNEVVRLLVADGRLDKPEDVTSWSVTIPQGVREVVGRRLDHLSEECNQVLTMASVIGRDFALRTLKEVSDLSEDALLETLEDAVAARVIAEVPNRVDHYTFTHALIKETLYEELSTARRVRLHRQIGEVLEESAGDDLEASLPQLAYHFSEAAQGGDVDKAIDYATRAAERAGDLLAYEDAANHYDRALQVLEMKESDDDVARCELLLGLGGAQFKSGNTDGSKETFSRCMEAARRLGDHERLAWGALGYAEFFSIGVSDETTVRFLEEALEAISEQDSALRARLLVSLSRELYFSESRERGRSLAHESIEMARRVNDPGALVQALVSRLFYVERGEDLRRQYERRYEVGEEIVRVAGSIGDKAMVLTGHYAGASTMLLLGDRDGADREIEEYTRLAEELRQPAFLWQAALFTAMTALLEGRMDDADRLSQEALAIGQRSEGQNALQMYGAQTYAIRREQGRVDEMEAGARGFVQQFPAVPAWRTALAFILCEVGKEDEARTEFEQLAKDDFAAIPRDGNWPIALALLSEICTRLGDMERAAALYEMGRPFADVCILVGTMIDCYGSGSRYLGQLASTLGRWDDAVQHFEHALEMNARLRSDRWVARTQLEYGRMLLARDEPGDREKAQALVTEALSTAEKRGMKAL
ncbi:MAG: tetratricopeptide repeat protein, partial [Chloroflexi bacterium]|nr:tetratricopeptide repeat protein [Chloroflexota bacterium]